ncbi:MAG: hypothetical protein H6Q53_2021 [Deltaproteobacteria bacterium]|nr:hypothetical protein [Deltaproteobacteria bacterium]
MKKLFASCFLVVVFLIGGIVSAHASFTINFDEFGNGFWVQNENGGDQINLEWTTAALPGIFGIEGEVLQFMLPESVNRGIARVFDPESEGAISQLMIFQDNMMWFVTESCDGENCAPAEFANWDALLGFIEGRDLNDGGGVSEANDAFSYAPGPGQAGAENIPTLGFGILQVTGNVYNGGSGVDDDDIPEPATVLLLGSGLLGLAGLRRKLKK